MGEDRKVPFPEAGNPPEHLDKDRKIDVRQILNGLEDYRPRRHPWH